VARGKGRILLEALAIPDSPVFALWPLASCVNSSEDWVETYLALYSKAFCEKNGTIFWGGYPLQQPPKGTWFSRRKPSHP
jgi:hypothetical protein